MLRPWSHSRVPSIAALIAVLALAACLRFWNLGAAEFKYDEARLCTLAADFVDTGVLPLRGMGSSTGIDNPPLAVYLMTMPILLSRDPLVATAFVALLNVVAVLCCYRLGRRYWSPGVGLVAAALLATSPWAIFYSRKVWAQNLLMPWTILFFASLLAWVVERKRWALAGAIATLAALTQIHFAALAFVPLFLLVLALAWVDQARQRKARALWAPLTAGVVVGLLLYVPYLVFDASHGWGNMRALVDLLRHPAQTHLEAVRFALLNIGGREIHSLAGPQQFRHFLDGILDLSYWPDRAEEALVVASLVYLLFRCAFRFQRNPRWRQESLLLLWLVVPVGFFLRQRSAVFPHYLLPLYPAPYLALAISAIDLVSAAGHHLRPGQVPQRRPDDATAQQPACAVLPAGGTSPHPAPDVLSQGNPPSVALLGSPRWARALAIALLGLLAAWQSYLSLSIHSFVGWHDTPGGMGTPIRIYQQVLRTMSRHATAWQNRQVIVLCPGDDPRLDECPAVFAFIAGRAIDVRLADRDSALLFPASAQDTLAVLAPGASRAAIELPRHVQEVLEDAVSLREETGYYRFYRLPAGYVPRPSVQPDGVPTHLANGVSLLGYDLPRPLTPSQPARLALYWQVDTLPASPPAQGYSFANHLLAAGGQRLAQQDGAGFHVRLWRPGDSIISWFDIPIPAELPPGPYRLQISMYVYTSPDQFATVPLVGATGQATTGVTMWPLQ